MKKSIIQGFSKLTKQDKIRILEEQLKINDLSKTLETFQIPLHQKLFDEISENTISNYILPYSIAPNFLINGETYHIPMVTEESSVVAAASAGAKFWSLHEGFSARVISTSKSGQVHFSFSGEKEILEEKFKELSALITRKTAPFTKKMKERGGGILSVDLEDFTHEIPDYYQVNIKFETVDSMGANFINTILEEAAIVIKEYLDNETGKKDVCQIIMSILSNYTPECLVECRVEAPINAFEKIDGEMPADVFIDKFLTAVNIAQINPFRAVTHNKGIMNGVDAVIIATGNDFRAIEAGAHAYASRKGSYASLSDADCEHDIFRMSVILPLAVGTTGGLTQIHPLAKKSLEILGNPNARQLMMIAMSAGMANHFSAIRALVTKGIQKGHMKMHLTNILNQLHATDNQKKLANEWFKDKTVSVTGVEEFLEKNK